MHNKAGSDNSITGSVEKDLRLFGSSDSDADTFAILALLLIAFFSVAFFLSN